MIKIVILILISLAILGTSSIFADPTSSLTSQAWRWQLDTAGYAESKISVYIGNQKVVSYIVECNLANNQADDSDEHSQIAKVISNNNEYGKLLVTCSVGAHSKLVQIYDPTNKLSEPVFSRVGSYQAGWRIKDHQLIIFYDEPCTESKTINKNAASCERFHSVSLNWPNSEE